MREFAFELSLAVALGPVADALPVHVVGSALYEGRFTLAEAMAAV